LVSHSGFLGVGGLSEPTALNSARAADQFLTRLTGMADPAAVNAV
jgi:hypothetical protein